MGLFDLFSSAPSLSSNGTYTDLPTAQANGFVMPNASSQTNSYGDFSPRSDAGGGFNWKGLLDLFGPNSSAMKGLGGTGTGTSSTQPRTLQSTVPAQPQLGGGSATQRLSAIDMLRQTLGLAPLFGSKL